MPIPLRTMVFRPFSVAAVLMALMGAQQGCSSTTTPDGVTAHGGTLVGRCTVRIAAPYVSGGQVIAYADVTCRSATARQDLTVVLQKWGPDGQWHQVATRAYNTAPALNTLKKATVGIACAPGKFRSALTAYAEPVDGEAGSGSAESPDVTVDRSQC